MVAIDGPGDLGIPGPVGSGHHPGSRRSRPAEPPAQATKAVLQVGLEHGFGPPEASPSFRRREPARGRLERTDRIGQAMLAQLRELDPRDDAEPAR